METTHELSRSRVRTNAERINRFELPFYADLVNARSKRYRLLLEMYAEIQRTSIVRRDSEYCAWQRLVNPTAGGDPATGSESPCRCATVQVRAPDKPIEINLNVKIDQEIRVKLDKDAEALIKDNPDIF